MDPPRPQAESCTATATKSALPVPAQGCLLGCHPPQADQAPSHHITSVPTGRGGCHPAGQAHGSERPDSHSHLEAAVHNPIPAPLCTPPPPCRRPGADKSLGQGGAGRAQDGSSAARGPRMPARAVPTAGPASPRNREPHPQPRCAWLWVAVTHRLLHLATPTPRSSSQEEEPWIHWQECPGQEKAPPAGRSPGFCTPAAHPVHQAQAPHPHPPRPRPPHPRPPAGARVQLPVGKAGSSPCLARVPGVVAGTTGGSSAPSSGSFRR